MEHSFSQGNTLKGNIPEKTYQLGYFMVTFVFTQK